jgi:hypothetical protein
MAEKMPVIVDNAGNNVVLSAACGLLPDSPKIGLGSVGEVY